MWEGTGGGIPTCAIYVLTGELFNVTVTIPKHMAEGFTWSRFWDDEDEDYNVRLKTCYVDPDTNSIMSSFNYFDWDDRICFLKVS